MLGIDDDDDGHLKGDPPNAFDGDRSRTLRSRTQCGSQDDLETGSG